MLLATYFRINCYCQDWHAYDNWRGSQNDIFL